MKKNIGAAFLLFTFLLPQLKAMEIAETKESQRITLNLANKKESILKIVDLCEGQEVYLTSINKKYTVRKIDYDTWVRKSGIVVHKGKILLSSVCNLDLSKDDVSPSSGYSFDIGGKSQKMNINLITYDIVPTSIAKTEAMADARQALRLSPEDSCRLKLIGDELCAVGDLPNTQVSGLIKLKLQAVN